MEPDGNLGNPENPAEVSGDEVAAAIAAVLAGEPLREGVSREKAIADLLMQLPDPPEPEAAAEAARLLLTIEFDGQKLC